jgi:putative lipoprotein
MKRNKFIFLLLVLMLAACTALPTTEPGVPVTGDGTATTPPEENSLAGSSWQLVSFGPVGATTPVVRETPITLEFGEDGQAGGHSGCNSYGGTYTVQNDSLEFGEITSTLIACADPSVTEQEQQYLQALDTASRFSIENDTLTIWYENEGSVLNFTRSDGTPETPEGTMTYPSPPQEPERVTFETGSDSAQYSGLLPSGTSVKQYLLTGSAGQTITVDVFSDDVPLSMTITEPNGMQRIPEMFPAEGGGYRIGHEFTLTESGDYLVSLTKSDHTPSTNYTADFTLR